MNVLTEPTLRRKAEELPDFYDFMMKQFRKHPEDLDLYVELALDDYTNEEHVPFLLLALRTVAEAKGVEIPNLMKPADLSTRATLDLAELRAILNALGYRLSATPLEEKKAE